MVISRASAVLDFFRLLLFVFVLLFFLLLFLVRLVHFNLFVHRQPTLRASSLSLDFAAFLVFLIRGLLLLLLIFGFRSFLLLFLLILDLDASQLRMRLVGLLLFCCLDELSGPQDGFLSLRRFFGSIDGLASRMLLGLLAACSLLVATDVPP